MKNRLLKHLTNVGILMFLTFSSFSAAQTASEDVGDRPLFKSHDVLDVRIEAPLTTLIKKRSDEEYLDGSFSYARADGTEQTLELKIRTRGKFRLQKSTCVLPPIRLNFKKGQLKGTEFAGEDKLKLVTHCKLGNDRFEQLVLREYLTYRILHTLTEQSFGARLLRINYIDTDGKKKEMTRYGFVIEDKDDIGDRLGLKLESLKSISYGALDARQTNLIAMYEFMIGNTDFSMIRGPADDECCHNIVPYTVAEGSYTPIPYDFDFSGIVDAPYALPNPQFKIRSVRTRVYRGRCANNEHLEETIALFHDKEAEIRGLVTNLPGLKPKVAKSVMKYIDGFYEIIGDPKKIEKSLIKKCS
jgi:hypothetical protein